MMLLPVLRAHARYLRDKPALIDDAGTTTYGELWDTACAIAADLRWRGLQPGEPVALLLPPSSAYVAIVLGVMLAGGVAAPVNTRLSTTEVAEYLARLRPALVWSDAAVDAATSAAVIVSDSLDPVTLRRGAAGGTSEIGAIAEPGARDGVIAFPTGGTTGLPKAALWSHGGLSAALLSTCMNVRTTRADTELYFSPMYHLTLVTGLFGVLLAGGSARILPSFDAERVTSIVRAGGATRFFATPVVIERILALAGDTLAAAGLSTVVFGASRSAHDFAARLQAALPRTALMTGYGATEFGAITRVFPDEILRDNVGVGRPVAGVQVEVRGPDGAALPRGESGEICARSPMQMLGYIGAAEASPASGDGWIRSGDVGVLDDQGYVHLRARMSELIKTGGEGVYPVEVERVVVQHPSVFDAVVYGVEDVDWGERVECAVIVAPGAVINADELRRHCAEQLGRYKVPKHFRVVSEFPRTSTLKLDRRALRDAALAATAAAQ